MSDFRANQKKQHVLKREQFLDQQPYQTYFLVPPELEFAAEKELPEFAGLMRAPRSLEVQQVVITCRAPVNKESRRLSIKEAIHLAHLMANNLIASEEKAENLRRNKSPNWYWKLDYEI